MKSSIMIDLDDPRTANIAEVISNKTCKRILNLLAEKSLSEADISKELKIPMNTVGYNIKKLMAAGLIEKSNYFWSVKGKKINTYTISQKRIVISPRSMLKGVVPAIIGSLLLAAGIKAFTSTSYDSYSASNMVTPSIAEKAVVAVQDSNQAGGEASLNYGQQLYSNVVNASHIWAWFLLGALAALLILLIWNYGRVGRKNE